MSILVTGGLGYIGSHTVVELINAGYNVVIADNLSNSNKAVLDRISKITGVLPRFYEIDLQDPKQVQELFDKETTISSVIHFAALKAVGESMKKPILYYKNNLFSTLNILEEMKKHNVNDFIFSSSATVYGDRSCPNGFVETDPIGDATNPYGETKIIIERILTDAQKANPSLKIILLRYFNPIGAHSSGLLGEDPNGVPNNLMPFITQVAVGRLPELKVFGNNYKTIDGTGVRDYIHVVDLALGHIAALEKIKTVSGLGIYNLGTGKGTSVLELVNAFQKVTGKKIPYQIVGRRPGDIDISFANVDKAKKELHWAAKRNVEQACLDSWTFQKRNPNGIQ
jgi:UDP-glucose 4-epimerase